MASRKNLKKPKKNSKATKQKKKSFVGAFFKWITVFAVWSGIIVVLLTAWYATELPQLVESTRFTRKSAVTIKAEDGSTIRRYGELKGVSVRIEDLPAHLIYAVIATEDRRFLNHHGIDPYGIARAMVVNFKSGRYVQGGSTITQQLAKNLFLSHERTIKRKIQEALLAIWLEKQLTKNEILSAYLNRVYFGGGTYGVEAASRLYFDKPASLVTLREAAMLAGLLRAPSRYSPTSNPGLAAKRAQVVLGVMADAGYITEAEARAQKLNTPLPRRKPSPGGSDYYYADWTMDAVNYLIGTPRDDLTIETTLSPNIQEQAEIILAKTLREYGQERQISQGAILVMASDGAILAMVGGRDYEASQFNRTTQAIRPPGSAFKPVIFLAALLSGSQHDDLIEDAPLEEGEYRPSNFKDEYQGNVTLEEALALSLNTAAVRLAGKTGMDAITDTAQKLGISQKLPRNLSLALGSHGVPMMELTTAYATIANNGYPVRPYGVTRIITEEDMVLYERMNLKPTKPVVDPKATRTLGEMLETVIKQGTGKAATLNNKRAAGKTGTSQDFRDAWFIGYTDDYIAAVWLGNDDNSPMKGVTGGTLPASMWGDLMENIENQSRIVRLPGILKNKEQGGFPSLLQRLLHGE